MRGLSAWFCGEAGLQLAQLAVAAVVAGGSDEIGGDLRLVRVVRDVARSPLSGPAALRPPAQKVANERAAHLTEPWASKERE